MSVPRYNICGNYKAFGIDTDTGCPVRTKHGLCPEHCRYFYGVEVKESSIPGAGMGLWATKDFKKKDFIVSYDGEHLTGAELERIHLDQREYIISLTKDYHLDGKYTNSSLGRYINDGKRSHPINCRFSVNLRNKTVKVKATKNIKNGSELFVSYGSEYWP